MEVTRLTCGDASDHGLTCGLADRQLGQNGLAGKLACTLVSKQQRDINNAFAEWLRAQMKSRGYPTEPARAGGRTRLADDAGVSLSVISRALNEGRTPDVDSLRNIGHVLGYSLGEMLIRAGKATADELPVRPKAATPEGGRRPGVLEAIDADPQLLPEAKEHIRNQYQLLLRVQELSVPEGKKTRQTGTGRTLRQVARKPNVRREDEEGET